jgi:hypothetical protein
MVHIPCCDFWGPEVITDEMKIQMPCLATNL